MSVYCAPQPPLVTGEAWLPLQGEAGLVTEAVLDRAEPDFTLAPLPGRTTTRLERRHSLETISAPVGSVVVAHGRATAGSRIMSLEARVYEATADGGWVTLYESSQTSTASGALWWSRALVLDWMQSREAQSIIRRLFVAEEVAA